RDGLVADEVERPVRDMARHPHRARGPRGRGRCGTYDRLELLPGRSMEAGAVDLLCRLLDCPAGLRPHHKDLFHAAQAIPRRGSAQGARRFLDTGDATGWTRRVWFQTRPVRLAHDGKHAV